MSPSTTLGRFPQFGLQNDIHLQPSCHLNYTYNSPTAYINSTGGLTSSGNFLTTTIPNVLNITPSGTIQALLPNLTYNILTTLNDQRNQQSQLHQSQQTTLGQQSLQQQGQSIPPVSIDVETLKQQIQMQNWSNNPPYSLIALNQKTLEQIHSSTNLLNFTTNQKLSTIQSNESTTPTINLSETSPTMWLLPAKIPRSSSKCVTHHSTFNRSINQIHFSKIFNEVLTSPLSYSFRNCSKRNLLSRNGTHSLAVDRDCFTIEEVKDLHTSLVLYVFMRNSSKIITILGLLIKLQFVIVH
ncbi:Musashi RNA-binding protein 1 [Schistosoma japonicum]|nr:Musashi RNA-binding protein 1 [Schistosoma japonicum]